MSDTPQFNPEIAECVKAYAVAFSGLDIDAICKFWHVPAVISAGETVTCFETVERFRDNVAALCAFYRAQGVAAAEIVLTACRMPLPSLAHVSASVALRRADGADVAEWTHHYTLRRFAGRWRIVFAAADEEVAAWAARGTPLG